MIYLPKLTLRAKNPALKKYLLAMKLSALLCFVGMIQVSASVFSQGTKLTVSYKDTSIKDVLNDIENKTEVRFFYNNDFLNLDRKITLEKTDIKLEDLLSEVLEPSGAKFKLLDDKLIVIAPGDMMQQRFVTGKITDSKTGDPIPGVSVLVKGTTLGSLTDLEGKFRVTIPEKSATLVISFIGYEKQEIPVTEGANVVVSLTESMKAMDEVVVIGYGSRTKKDVTTAISTVDASEILKTNAGQSAELAMQGKMTGVFVNSGGGNPNSRPTIQIRGVGTWGVSQPLYVIDGVPIYEYGYGAEGSVNSGYDANFVARVGTIRGDENIMSTINPADIESISVLKDASAAAIYGIRASNGVILITTKKGKGKAKVEFNAKMGFQHIPKTFNVLNVNQYVDLYTEAYANNPLLTLPAYLNPSDPGYFGNLPTVDWTSPFYTKNSKTQDYNLSVSGSSENTNYFVAIGHYANDGILINNNLNRYTVTSNVNSKVSKYINVGVNYRFVYQKADDNSPSNLAQTFAAAPYQRIRGTGPNGEPAGPNGYAPVIDTTYVYTPSDNPAVYSQPDYWPWQMNSTLLWGNHTTVNFYGLAADQDNYYTSYRSLGSAYAELEPIKGLKIKGTISLDAYQQSNFQYAFYDQCLFTITPADPFKPGDHHSLGSVSQRNSLNRNLVEDLSVNYSRSFGKHTIDILVNAESQQNHFETDGIGTEQLNSRIIDRVQILEAQRGFTNGSELIYKEGLIGYLGRLSYSYASKYYLDATLRRDGSYAFAPQNRWGNFPAFSAAWRITSESFMSNIDWLNDMKIRAGWGQLGNAEVKPYMYLSSVINYPHYSMGTTPQNGASMGTYFWGVRLGDFANENISWEKTATSNFAIDMVLLKYLNVTMEYYNKVTNGLLQTTSLPPSIGLYSNPVANVGKVRNRGFELSVGYTGRKGDFTYGIIANMTTVNNKVLSMFNHDRILNGNLMIQEGNSMNYIYGYKVGGIFQSDEEAQAYAAKTLDIDATGNTKKAGDMWFQNPHGNADLNNKFYNPVPDTTVNGYDQTYLGKTIPSLYYGISVNLGYKSFDLSANFVGVGGVQKYDYALANLSMMDGEANQVTNVLNRWTATKHSTTIPRAAEGDPGGNNRYSNRFVENAGYFRFANLQIGYTVPVSREKMKVADRIRIWVGGSNLFCLTPWKGLDPENDDNPVPRTYMLGIDASF